MNRFIEWLEQLSTKDTKVRAVLRRSLAFDPGAFVSAYPYVEPFVKHERDSWRRDMHYLVAGLWAAHWREGRPDSLMTIGKACAVLDNERRRQGGKETAQKLSSTEKRFVTLLDADQDQLSNRLRQMIALLKDQSIDFDALLTGLLYWNDDRKRTQNGWAQDFYRNLEDDTEAKPIIPEELPA